MLGLGIQLTTNLKDSNQWRQAGQFSRPDGPALTTRFGGEWSYNRGYVGPGPTTRWEALDDE